MADVHRGTPEGHTPSKAGVPSDEVERSPLRSAALLIAACIVILGLVGLGVWQVRRLAWKLDLIARVNQRVHAPAQAPPNPAAWSARAAADDEYRHVTVRGRFLNDRETLVQAVTELGAGFWVLTPLKIDTGAIVLINRGFVPPEHREPTSRAAGQNTGPTDVTGLLRLSEPKGGFLRRNAPAADRWYSRDVQAIAAARGLTDVAPYFIDADGTRNPGDGPVGGLTVIAFSNNHLVYAVTWFTLAAMLAGVTAWQVREQRRIRHRRASELHCGSKAS